MFRSLSLSGIILIAALMGHSARVVAEPENVDSANFVMPGCRDDQPTSNTGYFKAGICLGKISGIAYMQKESCTLRSVSCNNSGSDEPDRTRGLQHGIRVICKETRL